MAISPQRLTIYLYSAHRAVIFAIAQLSCNSQWRVCYPYYSMALWPGPSYKPTRINWIHSMYGANDASCTSDGTTSCQTMKFCVVPACSTSSCTS